MAKRFINSYNTFRYMQQFLDFKQHTHISSLWMNSQEVAAFAGKTSDCHTYPGVVEFQVWNCQPGKSIVVELEYLNVSNHA